MNRRRWLVLLVGSLPILTACTSARNTLAQELAWDQWKRCDHFDGITLKEIRPDGRIWVSYHTGNVTAWQECIRGAREEQASQRVVAAQRAARQPAPSGTSAAPSTATAPSWRLGDEWAFRWESPRGKGTFVWTVHREETVDGVESYVVRAGDQTEVFYRKADLAWLMDKRGGAMTARATPPQIRYTWPLTSGAGWEQAVATERPGASSTEVRVRACRVEGEETIVVPAGSFRGFKIACRNKQTDELIHQYWYAPEARNIVKEWTRFSWGVQERELIAYRLR